MSEFSPQGGAVTLCVLLWARPGAEGGLIAYEDQVLGIATGYGGQVLQRARGSGADGQPPEIQPLEIQLLRFPSAQALQDFMTDGRRQALAGERDRVIARTEVIDVELVPPGPD
ncbi:MAG: hypothetical protein ACRDOB_06930 [Streptosporangiaceae bacterium]